MSSPEHAADPFLRLVGTFERDERPDLVLMTGGEPLLRPQLVREIALRAGRVGTRSFVLTGMFFMRHGAMPAAIRRALEPIDHVSASLDVFHEREVPRARVFAALAQLLADGKQVSLHLVGEREGDPYLDQLIDAVRSEFGESVPMLVNTVRPTGRAAEWMPRNSAPQEWADACADPCAMAAWPVVAADGRIVACCHQQVVEGPTPRHLELGHAARETWSEVRSRCVGSGVLRAIRVLGPPLMHARRTGGQPLRCTGYCHACAMLADDPSLESSCGELFSVPSMVAVEQQVLRLQHQAGAVGFARRYGAPGYAELTSLGSPQTATTVSGAL